MKAIILAAGEGYRMRPLTYTRPKVMLPLANKPILEHLLSEVIKAGIRQFIFVVGYRDEQVRHYFGSGNKWGVKIDYCLQRKQLGTADAIGMAQGLTSGNFLVMNGDAIIGHKDIASLAGKSDITICGKDVEDTSDLWVLEVSEGRVVHIYE